MLLHYSRFMYHSPATWLLWQPVCSRVLWLHCQILFQGVACQSPLLKAPPTKSPLKSGCHAKGRKFKSPPRQAPPKKLRRLINRRLEIGLHRISASASANSKFGHFSQIRPNSASAKFLAEFGRIWQTPMQLQCVQLAT